MNIRSRGTSEFWGLYHSLPVEVREVARKNYRIWQANPFHPSLQFKPIRKPNWSVRVGESYRAVGRFIDDEFLWEWIGSHANYDKRF